MFSSRVGWYPPATAAGGSSAYFNISNTNSWINCASTTELITWRATSGFTCEYWVYISSLSSTSAGGITHGPGNHDQGGTNYWSFGPDANGALQLYYWAPGQSFIKTANSLLSANNWYALAFSTATSGSNTTVRFFINGTQTNISLNNNTPASTQTVTAAALSTGVPFLMGVWSGSSWGVYMDEVRVSNSTRYTSNYTTQTSNFSSDSTTQLLLNFTGADGSTTITDSSSANRTMTNNSNRVTISTTFFPY